MIENPAAIKTAPRLRCLTQKVHSPMGSVFVHIDIDERARVVSVRIDQSQKFEDTSVGFLLDCVALGFNKLLEDLQ